MSANSSIEWTQATWNPVRGCSRVSKGCENCYAERIAARFAGEDGRFEGLVRLSKKHGPQWTGQIRFMANKLDEPSSWREPRLIFVNSMSDLFHEGLRFQEIAAVFGAQLLAQRHTYQILTKRPERAVQFERWLLDTARSNGISPVTFMLIAYFTALGVRMGESENERIDAIVNAPIERKWWIGVSVEDQKTAGERIPSLLSLTFLPTVRFVSYEPALGPVDFAAWVHKPCGWSGCGYCGSTPVDRPRLDLIIVGGESGPRARPLDLAWVRSTRDQCRAAGVACFVKQLGAKPCAVVDATGNFRTNPETGKREVELIAARLMLRSRKGNDPSEWPEDLRVREFPRV